MCFMRNDKHERRPSLPLKFEAIYTYVLQRDQKIYPDPKTFDPSRHKTQNPWQFVCSTWSCAAEYIRTESFRKNFHEMEQIWFQISHLAYFYIYQ